MGHRGQHYFPPTITIVLDEDFERIRNKAAFDTYSRSYDARLIQVGLTEK